MALGVVDQHLDRVEAHRLGVDQPDQELSGIEQLEETRFVGRPGERRRMALGEPEARERGHSPEQFLGGFLVHAGLAHRTVHELAMELLHLARRPPCAHRPTKPVRIGRREPGHRDRHLHDLFLVQDHAEGLGQDRLQAGMEVGHRFEALLAAQVWMDGVALDRSGPNDRHFNDEIVQARRPRFRQGLHLGPTLHLEHADGIGGLEHRENLHDVLGNRVEIDAGGTVRLDELEGLIDGREHAQAQQIQLDQLERLDIALVELDDDAILHRRALQRCDIDERCRRHEHPAGMDAQVTREPVDSGAELEPALPVRHPDRAPAARMGRRL